MTDWMVAPWFLQHLARRENIGCIVQDGPERILTNALMLAASRNQTAAWFGWRCWPNAGRSGWSKSQQKIDLYLGFMSQRG